MNAAKNRRGWNPETSRLVNFAQLLQSAQMPTMPLAMPATEIATE
jgi:hypothetical protein